MQTTISAGWVTSPEGFTVILYENGVPVQVTPLYVKVGVTVMVATTGDSPKLLAVKGSMLPVPLAASPMEGVLFSQLKTVPGMLPEKSD